ncbi:GTPase domain-containing protein [Legionella maioricensis]|uniref:GTPase domain-containing protein n=1 Tax=Legionella maioricensis TaxID=2896528 RepID=A0A9X2CZE3_9GAMM|nr:GTPase domain-containing protein [Legionella maioricensis]MCL9683725.1 GTPase domain-containing protein [Legionella maioricensis]MCL9687499.1 GTPase domain-containing protein [Legionella maioricensis]
MKHFLDMGTTMILRATLMGMEKTGKTAIFNRLGSATYTGPITHQYRPTIAPDFNVMPVSNSSEPMNIQIWDMPGEAARKAMSIPLTFSSSRFGLYCVDLSIEMTEEMVSAAQKELNEYRAYNPDAQLILVGTKSDIALPNAMETAQNLLAEIPFARIISTSAQEENGLKDLQDFLTLEAKKLIPQNRRPCCCPQTPPVNAILKARNRCPQDSDLYHALNNLNNRMQHLDAGLVEAIGEEANILLNNIADPSVTDKTTSINLFIEKSNEQLQGKHHTLRNIILSVAITAAVTIIAGTIGFGIGFALGAWSGPGAFFTAIATGCASALAVTGGASLFGIGALAYTAHRFFKTTPVQESINEIAEAANESTPVQPY